MRVVRNVTNSEQLRWRVPPAMKTEASWSEKQSHFFLLTCSQFVVMCITLIILISNIGRIIYSIYHLKCIVLSIVQSLYWRPIAVCKLDSTKEFIFSSDYKRYQWNSSLPNHASSSVYCNCSLVILVFFWPENNLFGYSYPVLIGLVLSENMPFDKLTVHFRNYVFVHHQLKVIKVYASCFVFILHYVLVGTWATLHTIFIQIGHRRHVHGVHGCGMYIRGVADAALSVIVFHLLVICLIQSLSVLDEVMQFFFYPSRFSIDHGYLTEHLYLGVRKMVSLTTAIFSFTHSWYAIPWAYWKERNFKMSIDVSRCRRDTPLIVGVYTGVCNRHVVSLVP